MTQLPAVPHLSRLVANPTDFQKILWRLARELQEGHPDAEPVTLCGIVTRGVHLADRLRRIIEEQGGKGFAAVRLDVGPYRDDRPRPPLTSNPLAEFPIPPAATDDVEGRTVVLVDDVLYHGRTARAALAALAELGRPRAVELLTVVDRGHRELPLRATYVGRNLPTATNERVLVRLVDCDGEDAIRVDSET